MGSGGRWIKAPCCVCGRVGRAFACDGWIVCEECGGELGARDMRSTTGRPRQGRIVYERVSRKAENRSG